MPASAPDYPASLPSQSLPIGTELEGFVIERVLGSGGFGITYLARDKRLGRQVVVKENLPAQFCWREPSSLTVRPHRTEGTDAGDFQYSMESFEREASTLASLDHPGIVKVLQSFEAHGTACFVMPFVEGKALDDLIRQRAEQGAVFTEDEVTNLLLKALDALEYLHERGIYHRDLKPGNILMTKAGPVLIDFGAARQRLSERSLTVIESAGYTPFEQLQSRGKIGPWSDLYALGGTLYKAITGETPAKANDRAFDDPVVPLTQREELRGRYAGALLASIDKAMSTKASDRFQDAGQWREPLMPTVPILTQRTPTTRVPVSEQRSNAPPPVLPTPARPDPLANGFAARWYYKSPHIPAALGPISQEQLLAKIRGHLVKPDFVVMNEEESIIWERVAAIPQLAAALKPIDRIPERLGTRFQFPKLATASNLPNMPQHQVQRADHSVPKQVACDENEEWFGLRWENEEWFGLGRKTSSRVNRGAYLIIGITLSAVSCHFSNGSLIAPLLGGSITGIFGVISEATLVLFIFVWSAWVLATRERLKNIGAKSWVGAVILLPFISVFVLFYCLALPPDFKSHRKLDSAAYSVIAIFVILLLLTVIGLLASPRPLSQ